MPRGEYGALKPKIAEEGVVSGEIKAQKRTGGEVSEGQKVVLGEELQRSENYKKLEGERRAAKAYDIAFRAARGEALTESDANEIKRLGKKVMLEAQIRVNAELAQIDEQMKSIKDAAEAEEAVGEFAQNAQVEADLDRAMTSERAQMVDKGVAVEKRLDAVRGELKSLGYDLDANVAKPPFWGSLTKKGRLIIEFNKLAADENYQYLLQAREDNKKRTGEEKKKYEARTQKRAMDYRVGGLTKIAELQPVETRKEREKENIEENDYESRLEQGKLKAAERIKEGEKINKMMKGIESELRGFSLSLADLAVPMDRKTAKILKNAGTDVGKLRTEYFSLLNSPDYKYWLDQKEK